MSETKTFLTESKVDNPTIHLFLKKLSTPYNKWPAYRMGLIDDRGNILRQIKTLSSKEKESFTTFDILVLNLKKIIEETSKGRSRLSNYIASLYLIKEYSNAHWYQNVDILYESYLDFYEEIIKDSDNLSHVNQLLEDYLPINSKDDKLEEEEIEEDAPANSVAGGQVAGLTGDPVVRIKRKKSLKEFEKSK